VRIESKTVLVAVATWFTLLGQAGPTPAQARSVFARCADQVGATYMGEGRWRFSGSIGAAQSQNFYNCIDSHTQGQQSSSRPAVSQRSAGAKRRVAQPKSKSRLEEFHAREAFSGSEFRIAAMGHVRTDCSGGALPEVRVVTPPGGGDVRQEPVKFPVSHEKSHPRARCNGKIVDAVAVFYKSKSDFAGADKVVLDVDFKVGVIKRFTYAINIR
jgi:hypothetical protein